MSTKITETIIGNYVVRHKLDAALIFHKKDKSRSESFRSLEPLNDAIDWIRNVDHLRTSWTNINAVNIMFNPEFMLDIMGGAEVFYYEIVLDNEKILMNISLSEKCGYTTAKNNSYGDAVVNSAKSAVGKKLAESLTLLPNARYALVETSEQNQFELMFDSVVSNKNDRYRLGVPGLGVNSTRT